MNLVYLRGKIEQMITDFWNKKRKKLMSSQKGISESFQKLVLGDIQNEIATVQSKLQDQTFKIQEELASLDKIIETLSHTKQSIKQGKYFKKSGTLKSIRKGVTATTVTATLATGVVVGSVIVGGAALIGGAAIAGTIGVIAHRKNLSKWIDEQRETEKVKSQTQEYMSQLVAWINNEKYRFERTLEILENKLKIIISNFRSKEEATNDYADIMENLEKLEDDLEKNENPYSESFLATASDN